MKKFRAELEQIRALAGEVRAVVIFQGGEYVPKGHDGAKKQQITKSKIVKNWDCTFLLFNTIILRRILSLYLSLIPFILPQNRNSQQLTPKAPTRYHAPDAAAISVPAATKIKPTGRPESHCCAMNQQLPEQKEQKGKNAPLMPEKRCKNHLNKFVFYATLTTDKSFK